MVEGFPRRSGGRWVLDTSIVEGLADALRANFFPIFFASDSNFLGAMVSNVVRAPPKP